jgi:RNA polymerase sigma-70 factor (ECF subfamily)
MTLSTNQCSGFGLRLSGAASVTAGSGSSELGGEQPTTGLPRSDAFEGEESHDVSLAREGDLEAFDRLAVVHEARLFRQAVGLCANHSVAEDLAAETLIAAWKGVRRFRGGCRFSTWLYGILVHRYLKYVRRQRARLPSLSSFSVADAGQGEERLMRIANSESEVAGTVEKRDTAQQLRWAVDQLAPVHQAVILLRFFEQAQLSEIAAALEIPLGTVKSRLHHALQRLRRMPHVMNLLDTRGDSAL